MDNCNRTENPLSQGGQWAGNFQAGSATWLANGTVCQAASDTPSSTYWGTQLGADQKITATWADANPSGSQHVRLFVRLQEPSASSLTYEAYRCHFLPGVGQVEIFRVINGTATSIAGPVSRSMATGHEMGCEVVGSQVSLYYNAGGGWTQLLTVSDTQITGPGYVGLWMSGTSVSVDTIGLATIGTAVSTYHVATTGSDAVSCATARNWATNPANAKATIQAGLNCATTPGDTVEVHLGSYVGNLTSAASGTSGNRITLRAAADNVVTIQGSITLTGHDWLTLQDLQIESQGLSIVAGATQITLTRVQVLNAPSHAITLDGSAGALDAILIDGCQLIGSGGAGIRGGPENATVQKSNVTIRQCTITDHAAEGISLSNTNGVTLTGNRIERNGLQGMALRQRNSTLLIEDNTLAGNGADGILVTAADAATAPPFLGGAPLSILRNTVYGNGSAAGQAQISLASLEIHATIRSLLVNNVIQGASALNTDGLALFRASKVDIYHNTIDGVSRFGLQGRCYRDGTLRNNLISGLGRAVSFEASTDDCTNYANGLITEDYNLLVTSGPELIRWTDGATYPSLSEYQAGSGQGAHSLSVDPLFVRISP